MTTSSDDLLLRALAVGGALIITIGVHDGEPEYTVSIRKPGLDSWKLAHDPDPIEALRKAVERCEDKRDLI